MYSCWSAPPPSGSAGFTSSRAAALQLPRLGGHCWLVTPSWRTGVRSARVKGPPAFILMRILPGVNVIYRIFEFPLACRRAFRVFTFPLACRRGFQLFSLIDRFLALPLARRRAFQVFMLIYRVFWIPLACRRAFYLFALFVLSTGLACCKQLARDRRLCGTLCLSACRFATLLLQPARH